MKKILYVFLMAFLFVGCKNKSEMTKEEMIAGKDEKTWEAKRETNASGDKDRLTREEKKERITFWRDGKVRMGDGNESQSGQWSLQGNNLSLVFGNSNVSENFTVLELDENDIKLRAADGSEMTMKPD